MGDWLRMNRKKMEELALMINASASRKMYVIFGNLGPACYNATVLRSRVNINKNNIAVATSDLGLEILPILAEIAEVPMRNIFCPPVWGFIGINEVVDVRTTVHKYNSFEPYDRYTRVQNTTLNIGMITPEMRTMDYLMHFDNTLWPKVALMKSRYSRNMARLNKAISIVHLANLWLLNPNPEHIVCLGIYCNGTFGINFDGLFSQPARFIDGTWVPAADYSKPKDPGMKLPYMVQMAKYVMTLKPGDLPPVVPYFPCTCKSKTIKKKHLLD
ncbi:unnamed protein product [Chrysodeixis includens]|uniref:Uncharacterized protein n=1 Tax=Chrysodeixis includens TaxID=689277 RepID=A0A9N8PXU4_CHRIL|nr:unnamed protein product [Chrysodeixis includens]